MDAAVPNDFPLFTVQIFDTVGIVATAGMLGAGSKQVGQRLGCRGAVYPGQFDFTAKILCMPQHQAG